LPDDEADRRRGLVAALPYARGRSGLGRPTPDRPRRPDPHLHRAVCHPARDRSSDRRRRLPDGEQGGGDHHPRDRPPRLGKRSPESIFQPSPMFHNNLWRVPFAVRIMASACTQWQMFLSSRPDRLVAFSSYSMSLELVIKVDYWDDDVIPEDSRFYWKSFFATSGRLRMVPVFLPIYGDAPEASDRGMPWERVQTHADQYNQIKRWAWGVSDVPFVTVRLLRHPEIGLWLRARRYGYMIFNHLTWTTL